MKNMKSKMVAWIVCASLLVGNTASLYCVQAAGTNEVAQETVSDEAVQAAGTNEVAQETSSDEVVQATQEPAEAAMDENVNSEVAYYVNCNDITLPEGEKFGIYNNGQVDQAYVEGDTGYNWGYGSAYTYDSPDPAAYGGYSVRMIKGDDAAPLTYYFELPAGKYNLEVGVPHCTQWGNRVMNVNYSVGEQTVTLISNLNTTNDITSGEIMLLTSDFEVSEEKKVVTVTAVRSNGDAWAPFLGTIKIKKQIQEDALVTALADAEALYTAGNESETYTTDSWNAFAQAYTAALALKDSTDATARAAAAAALSEAQEKLEATIPSNVDAGVAYYVNCNDTDLPEGEKYGIYNNGAADQIYTPGAEGEYHWGYDGDYSYEESLVTSDYSGYSVRMIRGNDGAALTYSFELPAGKYNLEVGVPYCNQGGNRVMNVDYQIGDVKTNLATDLDTTNNIEAGTVEVLSAHFEVAGEKQVVTVTAVRSYDNAWAPFLGYIKISMDNELPVATVRGHSLTLDGSIGVNFYLEFAQEVLDKPSDYYVVVSNESGTSYSEIEVNAMIANGSTTITDSQGNTATCYKATGSVAAKGMTDKLTMQLKKHTDEKVMCEDTYSVKAYMTGAQSSTDGTLVALVNAMAVYGTYSQKYFGYNTNDMPSDLADLSGVTTDTLGEEYNYTVTTADNSPVQFYGASLLLKTDTIVRYYFKLNEGQSMDDLTFEIDGSAVTPTSYSGGNSLYYIDKANIKAQNLSVGHTITVEQDSNQYVTVQGYSALSYAKKALDNSNSNESIKVVVKALYLYWDKAVTYFQKI